MPDGKSINFIGRFGFSAKLVLNGLNYIRDICSTEIEFSALGINIELVMNLGN